MRRAGQGIAPIFPQQSIREMTRTRRTPEAVMADAVNALAKAEWADDFGADADHLKTRDDIDATVAAGFTFFTIDPSAAVDPRADAHSDETLRARFDEVRAEIDWFDEYLGRSVLLPTDTRITFDEEALLRAAVKYGRAIEMGLELSDHVRAANEAIGRDYEIELSVDETDHPTTTSSPTSA
jgi:hypothetical protein